jgi:hypothetical protein
MEAGDQRAEVVDDATPEGLPDHPWKTRPNRRVDEPCIAARPHAERDQCGTLWRHSDRADGGI